MNTTNNQPKTLFSKLFSNFGEKLIRAILRFSLTFICIIGVAVLFILAIKSNTDDVYTKWIMGGIVSAFATLSYYLFAGYRWKKHISHTIKTVIFGLIMWLFSTFPNTISDANATQFAMLLVSFVLALFFAGFLFEKNSLWWWDNLRETLFQMVISGIFAGILMGGLSLALVSLDKLFGINVKDELYQYLAVFCFVLFMPSYFMAQIPNFIKPATPSDKLNDSNNDENFSITYPMIFKILGLYILLPILAIYTVILYGYLIKIIAIWELPNGWVSWLVSILGFAGFITMIILHPLNVQSEHKITKLFCRFFPIILFPLLVLMFVGIVRRFSDYGMTINRLLVLILNLWFIGVSIYLVISRSRQPKWILISFAAVAFLSAIGPWSVLNVTENSLKKELSQLLTEANWTNSDNTKITPLSKEKQIRLSDVAYYLQRTYGIQSIRPMFSSLGENADVGSLIKKMGILVEKEKKDNFYINIIEEKSFDFQINSYNTSYFLKHFNNNETIFKTEDIEISIKNDNVLIKQKTDEISIPLKSIIEKGIATDKFLSPDELTIQGANYKLIIFSLYGEFDNDNSVVINRFEGLLLMK